MLHVPFRVMISVRINVYPKKFRWRRTSSPAPFYWQWNISPQSNINPILEEYFSFHALSLLLKKNQTVLLHQSSSLDLYQSDVYLCNGNPNERTSVPSPDPVLICALALRWWNPCADACIRCLYVSVSGGWTFKGRNGPAHVVQVHVICLHSAGHVAPEMRFTSFSCHESC